MPSFKGFIVVYGADRCLLEGVNGELFLHPEDKYVEVKTSHNTYYFSDRVYWKVSASSINI